MSITLNSVTQEAILDANGNFSTTFNTAALTPANYVVTYSYAGDSDFNSAAGSSLLSIPNQAAPQVNTGAATSVSGTGATLHGSVNPLGSTTTALIQYSTDANFTPTIASTVGSGFSDPTGVAVDAAGNVFVADHRATTPSIRSCPTAPP